MRIVVALGGNALLKRGERPRFEQQRVNARKAANALAPLCARHEIVITHGNGPQIGLLALQGASDSQAGLYPLDVLGAETDGMIGHLLQQELANAGASEAPIAVLSQILVDPADPAFETPSKFIGATYAHETAQRMAAQHGWKIARDGDSWRRVVASPEPKAILGVEAIRLLVERRYLVICAGGGGIPVRRDDRGTLSGVEAVIDKDLTAALLARELRADCLMMLTDVDAVYLDWGTPQARAIRAAHPETLDALTFPAGSMGPKIEAGCRHASHGGTAYIGALDQAEAILAGNAGTHISMTGTALTLADAVSHSR